MKLIQKPLQLTVLAIALPAMNASAATISQVVTSGGSTGDNNINGDAFLESFVADGVTYTPVTGFGVNDPSPAGRVWSNTIADPGSDTIAVSDFNLGTGTLNNGNTAQFDLTGQALSLDTTLFIFTNGNGVVNLDPDTGDATGRGGSTPPGTLAFVDAMGATLGTLDSGFFFQGPEADDLRAPNLLSFDFFRDGNDLNGRTISGAIFTLGDVAFTSGGVADIAGFTVQSGTADIQDVGIAEAVAVPEPSSIALFGLGGLLLARRRRA